MKVNSLRSFLFLTNLSLLLCALNHSGYAENQISKPIGIGGGLNIKTAATDIDDNETPDESNMINGQDASAVRRNGSDRVNTQAISSNPICSLYHTYISTGTSSRRIVLATTRDSIYYSTTAANPAWILISSGLFSNNQHFSFTTMNNRAIMSGDKQTDNIKEFDLNNTSFSDLLVNDPLSTGSVNVHAKYLIDAKNYLVGANCAVTDFANNTLTNGSTNYPSRIYYSVLLQPSSFTAQRFIDIRADDGDQITGMGFINKLLNIFKQNSIWELDFSVLNPVGYLPIGDQVLRETNNGFGLIAPRTLVNTGDYYYFLSRDGIRKWSGGTYHLTTKEDSEIVSDKIKPLMDSIIRSGTFKNAEATYYGRKQWYLLSIEDPSALPHGKNNTVLLYDIDADEWHRFRNITAECWETTDGLTDTGILLFGDSLDGYVNQADLTTITDDARSEMVLDTCDSTDSWTVETAVHDITNVKEGTASIKMAALSPTVTVTSVTRMGLLDIGSWADGTAVSKSTNSDLFHFMVYVSSPMNLFSLRMDLELNDAARGDFDSFFSSVTFSSAALNIQSSSWATVEVPISSFPILAAWTDINTGSIPFANTLSVYGLRFVSSGTNNSQVSIDDIRVVQRTRRPLNAYRFSKQFSLGSLNTKSWKQLVLTLDAGADSNLSVDVFTNFGQDSGRIDLNGDFDHSMYVGDFGGTYNISRISTLGDYTVLESSQANDKSVFANRSGVVDDRYYYGGDQYNSRIFKILKSSISGGVFVSSFGSNGTGAQNFNGILQMAVDDKNLYICDFFNHRIKVHDKGTLAYVNSFGTLGSGATSFHSPTGVAVDEKSMWVGDDANYSIKKLNKRTGQLLQVLKLNYNDVGDLSVAVDSRYLFDSYNTFSDNTKKFQNVVLEKRNKSDMTLLTSVILRPVGNPTLLSTYTIVGSISQSDDYMFVSYTDDANDNGNYYLQKIYKSDLSVQSEYKSRQLMYTPAVNGLAYRPKLKTIYRNLDANSVYIQLKYSENNRLDNAFRLFNQSFIFDEMPVQEKN